jgi:WD40 repeat protein
MIGRPIGRDLGCVVAGFGRDVRERSITIGDWNMVIVSRKSLLLVVLVFFAVSTDALFLPTKDCRSQDVAIAFSLDSRPVRIHALQFSRTGKELAVGYRDGVLNIWGVRQRRIQHTLRGDPAAIYDVEYSLDGTILGSAGGESVKLWDVSVNPPKLRLDLRKHASPVNCLDISEDGKILATGEDRCVKTWDTTSGRLVSDAQTEFDIRDICLLPGSQSVVFAEGLAGEGSVRYLNLETAASREIARFKGGAANLSLSNDKAYMAVLHEFVSVWNLPEKKMLAKMAHSVSEPNRRETAIYEDEKGEVLLEGPAFRLPICIGLRFDGRLLASGDNFGRITFWDALSGAKSVSVEASDTWITEVAFSHDGRLLATGDVKGRIRVLRVGDALPHTIRE